MIKGASLGVRRLWCVSGVLTLDLSETETWATQSNKGKEGRTKGENIRGMSVLWVGKVGAERNHDKN